ncbi:uncharacterized protein (UPF0335 family) [Rhizobium leguminosarum]
MTDVHGVARDQLRAFIERIERLEEEKKSIADDIKDVYGEAKGMGFDTVIMKRVIALRKKDEQQRMEEEAVLDTYLHALGMIAQPDLFEEPHHPEMGEIIDPKLAQTIVTGMQTEIGRKALIAAVDIMIAREEAAEEFHTNPEEGAEAKGAVTDDAEDRGEGDTDRQRSPEPGTTDGGRQGVREQEASPPVPASNAEIDPNEDRSEGQSLDVESADANRGGDHVTAQAHCAASAGALVQVAPATKPLRPHCRNPGEHCGGYGSNHCHSCLRAAREPELEACT